MAFYHQEEPRVRERVVAQPVAMVLGLGAVVQGHEQADAEALQATARGKIARRNRELNRVDTLVLGDRPAARWGNAGPEGDLLVLARCHFLKRVRPSLEKR